nr:RecName: Full=Glycine-rich RNA-binding protein 1 [Populus euphratica]
GFGFVTFGNEK